MIVFWFSWLSLTCLLYVCVLCQFIGCFLPFLWDHEHLIRRSASQNQKMCIMNVMPQKSVLFCNLIQFISTSKVIGQRSPSFLEVSIGLDDKSPVGDVESLETPAKPYLFWTFGGKNKSFQNPTRFDKSVMAKWIDTGTPEIKCLVRDKYEKSPKPEPLQ